MSTLLFFLEWRSSFLQRKQNVEKRFSRPQNIIMYVPKCRVSARLFEFRDQLFRCIFGSTCEIMSGLWNTNQSTLGFLQVNCQWLLPECQNIQRWLQKPFSQDEWRLSFHFSTTLHPFQRAPHKSCNFDEKCQFAYVAVQ